MKKITLSFLVLVTVLSLSCQGMEAVSDNTDNTGTETPERPDDQPQKPTEAIEYDRTEWTVEASHELFNVNGNKEGNSLTSAIDGDPATNFCLVRPGKQYGIKVPKEDEVYFIIDMREAQMVNYFRLVWRHDGTSEMWCRIYQFDRISGSNDGINFTKIATRVKTGADNPSQNSSVIALPDTEYRYYKFTTTNPVCWTWSGEEADCPYANLGLTAGNSNQINEIYLGYDPEISYSGKEFDSSAFHGKKLAAFGNSITAGDNSWAFQLRYLLDFGDFYNGAVGGAIWGKRKRDNGTTQDYDDPDFAGISNSSSAPVQARYNNCGVVHVQKFLADRPDFIPDYILLSYGTNDRVTETDELSAEDMIEKETCTLEDAFGITGGMRWCIETLQERFPQAKTVVLFPIQANPEKYPNKNRQNLEKIAKIKAMCDAYGIEYFDCYHESGIDQSNVATHLRDGLHPNIKGQLLHSDYIARKLIETEAK